MRRPIALAISDIHLSHVPPTARSAELDWMDAQARVFDQLASICDQCGYPPLLIAGDLFHRWQSPPELIYFALGVIDKISSPIYAVPGQHDLPNHRLDHMHRAPYGVLERVQSIHDVSNQTIELDDFVLNGFPWGHYATKPPQKTQKPRIALVHAYCWTTDRTYPGAHKKHHVSAWSKHFQGYDLAIFGDNHHRFIVRGQPTVINCGCFIPRTMNERDCIPTVTAIYDDLETRDFPLDGVPAQWQVGLATESMEEDAKKSQFVEALARFDFSGTDFGQLVEQYITALDPGPLKNTMREILRDACP